MSKLKILRWEIANLFDDDAQSEILVLNWPRVHFILRSRKNREESNQD